MTTLDASLILGGLLLVLIVVRFIQPEVIYAIRRGVNTTEAGIALRAAAAGARSRHSMAAILSNDVRTIGVNADRRAYEWRPIKIREMLETLEGARRSDGSYSRMMNPAGCLQECAHMVEQLAAQIAPAGGRAGGTVSAAEVLALIARSDEKVLSIEELESYFDENPMSIEQAVELTTAVIVGLFPRLQPPNREGE